MIGRKRIMAASRIAGSASSPSFLRSMREVDHHDRVFLHDADQQQNADDGDDRQIHAVPASVRAGLGGVHV